MTTTRRASHPKRPRTVVALGASAGGLESLGRLLEGLPATFPAPVLVVLHLDPHHRSQAVPLLQNRTRLRVQSARTGIHAKAGAVYVAPPDHHLEIHAGKLRLTHAARVNYSRPSVDLLFNSVAADYGPAAIVAVLSGTGSDGAQGVEAVKGRGGLALAEAASTARFPGMPLAAGRTGLLDAVLPIDQIPAFLLHSLARRVKVSQGQWLRLLALLESKTGIKFSRYRSSTLHRRLQHRLAATGCRTMASYLLLLQRDGAEVERLQSAFLIKVSSFLRDPASWRLLARELARLAPLRPYGLRAWSAGCANGEEAYSLALLLARVLGVGAGSQWKVFATDIDPGALKLARAARYSDAQVREVPKADLARHFVREGRRWRVGKALRSRVVFGRHDLLHDPPLSGLDVLACRNVLIYFMPEEKQRTLGRLSVAINPGGILFLGRSEGVGPLHGFERRRDTTLFRRRTVSPVMPARKNVPRNGAPPGPSPSRPRSAGPAARLPPRRRTAKQRASAQQELNEELQSRNEELETVNEELQSLNDELSVMEKEMRDLAEENERSNSFLRVLLDTASKAFIACDADNRIVFWNKAAVKRYRLSPAQAVGNELFGLVPALDNAALRAASRKARAPGRGGREVVEQGGAEYLFDPLPPVAGKRRGYLLSIRPASS